jgi:hypothetical protein
MIWYILNDREVLPHNQLQLYQPIITYQQEILTKRNMSSYMSLYELHKSTDSKKVGTIQLLLMYQKFYGIA